MHRHDQYICHRIHDHDRRTHPGASSGAVSRAGESTAGSATGNSGSAASAHGAQLQVQHQLGASASTPNLSTSRDRERNSGGPLSLNFLSTGDHTVSGDRERGGGGGGGGGGSLPSPTKRNKLVLRSLSPEKTAKALSHTPRERVPVSGRGYESDSSGVRVLQSDLVDDGTFQPLAPRIKFMEKSTEVFENFRSMVKPDFKLAESPLALVPSDELERRIAKRRDWLANGRPQTGVHAALSTCPHGGGAKACANCLKLQRSSLLTSSSSSLSHHHRIAIIIAVVREQDSALLAELYEIKLSRQRGPPDLLSLKKEFNELSNQHQRKAQELERLIKDNALTLSTKTDHIEEAQRATRKRELNMKLVTLKTRLVEADENKKNYSLYYLRMKEEDVLLSKNIDVLRTMVLEYDRLLKKTAARNDKILVRKSEIDEEIQHFGSEIELFNQFAGGQLSSYRRLVLANLKKVEALKAANDSLTLKESRKRELDFGRLSSDQAAKEFEAIEIREEALSWADKVEYYEKRFHKIVSATGEASPEGIVRKYKFCAEVAADLALDVKSKQNALADQKAALAELEVRLQELRDGFAPSSWKELDGQLDRAQKTSNLADRSRKTLLRLVQKANLAQVGLVGLIKQLARALDPVLGPQLEADPAGPALERFPDVDSGLRTDPGDQFGSGEKSSANNVVMAGLMTEAAAEQWFRVLEQRMVWLCNVTQAVRQRREAKLQEELEVHREELRHMHAISSSDNAALSIIKKSL